VELASSSTPGDQTFMLTFRLANIGNPLGFDLPGM
jgi:LPS-assembly protein